MTSLHVICGLGLPPPESKFLATSMTVLNEKTELLAVPLKVLSQRIQQNAADVNAKKECFTIIKRKC